MTQVASIGQDGGRLVLARYLEPLNRYLADESLTEIVINRPGEVFVEGPDGWTRHKEETLTHDYLSHLATAAAGHTRQDIGPEFPIVSTSLLGEERCQIVVPPAVPAGQVSFTIRKPSKLTMNLTALERTRLFDEVRSAGDELHPDEHLLLALKEGGCQSARKFDPVSASNFDPFARRGLRVALDSSELAGIAETRRARAA